MKEIIIINYMGRFGSGNIHALVMAKELIKVGENVVAIVSAYSENIEDWKKLKLEKLIVVKTYNTNVEFIFKTIEFYLVQSYKIKNVLSVYKVKAIYCPMCTYWTYGLNRVFKNCNVISCNHDPIPHSGDHKKFLFDKVYKKSNIIIVHSKKFVGLVHDMFPNSRVEYMPLTRIKKYTDCEKRKAVEYDRDKVNFLFFGVISVYKGLDVLAEAYGIVKKNMENITLTIAGRGDFTPYKARYERLQDVNIVNRWIDDEEVESFFSGENVIVVLPYIDATQSGVVMVAMEYGTPIIATRTGGLTEQIEDGVLGILVEPSDAKSLANAMMKLASDKEMRKHISNNLIKKIREADDSNLAYHLLELIDTMQ